MLRKKVLLINHLLTTVDNCGPLSKHSGMTVEE